MSERAKFCDRCGYNLSLHRTSEAGPLCPDLPSLLPGTAYAEKLASVEAALSRAISERDAARDNFLKAQKARDAALVKLMQIRRLTDGCL